MTYIEGIGWLDSKVMPADLPPLGTHVRSEGTSFALWAPSAELVELTLFEDSGRKEIRLPLEGGDGPIWRVFVPGVRAGQRYGFRLHGPWQPDIGLRFNPNKLLIDPYVHSIIGDL